MSEEMEKPDVQESTAVMSSEAAGAQVAPDADQDRRLSPVGQGHTPGRKEKIKNVIIIFLVILLVLTFFSNTWMNRTLPEVATAYVESGSISPKIRGTGTVEADNPYKVMVKQSRKVASVLVRAGDTVSRGDPLYELEDMESEELKKAQDELISAEAALRKTASQYEKDMFNGDVGDRVITDVREGETEDWDSFQKQLKSITGSYEAAEAALADAKKTVQDLKTRKDVELNRIEYERVQNDYEIALLEMRIANGDESDDTNNRRNELVKNKSQLATFKTQTSESYDSKISVATSAETDAQTAFDKIKEKKEQLLTSIGSQIGLETSRSDVTAAEEAVARAQAKVDKLTAESEGTTVDAPVDGIITTLGYVAGETTNADTAAAVIQVAGRDMITSFSVTNAQARKVHVGDAAEPQNAWFYSDFSATLSAIKTDPADPAGKKLLEFKIVSPEVQAGQSVSLQIGQTAQNYDLIVPNSAVRQDNNGKFVLIVQSKPSPLGNRYVASRVDVEVQESDDNNSAISAALSGYEYVITTSSEPIKAGQYVRLAEGADAG